MKRNQIIDLAQCAYAGYDTCIHLDVIY